MQIPTFLQLIYGLLCLPNLFTMDICPKVCIPCLENIFSCTMGGLDEIPKDLYIDTKKVTLIGHSFSQLSLTRQNFSQFSKPKYSIEQLSIRQSNLQKIHSNAFFDLSGLDSLDLSNNLLLVIDDRAFANLKLKHLKLDNIHNLTLALTSFDGLLVASLSITNSRLQTFPFSLLEPLSKELRKLFLSKNNLRTLSSKFETLFRQLTVLELHGNPLLCSCNLLWMSTTLRWRQQYFNIQVDSFSLVESPKCSGPPYLKDEYVDRIPESDFDCHPPKLERIDIQFKNLYKATLRCVASLQAKRAPMNILWTYINKSDDFHHVVLSTLNRHESTITIVRKESLDKFICSMHTGSGNVSVKVNLNWPNVKQIKSLTNVTLHNNGVNFNPSSESFDFTQNIFFKEQYTLLELMGSVIGTFIITMLIFIIIYRFYFYKAVKLKKEQLKKTGCTTYEIGLYSDSQTYDIPQYPSFDNMNKLFRPMFTMPYPNKHLVDYTNH